ncbi:MAG: HPr family phosphocarrier protein [Ruminococcus sp.]|nr:HPr family phosphocarrier protein [Ruminococcus sp.]
MLTKKVTVVNPEGLHLRPVGVLAKAVKAYPESEVLIRFAGKEINAGAVMQLMTAGIKMGAEVELAVSGGDEQAVLDELVSLFESGFNK